MACECPGYWRIDGKIVTCEGCEETRQRYNYDFGAPCKFGIGNKASNEDPPRPLCKFCWLKCPGWHLKPERRTPAAFLQQPPAPPGAAVAVPGLSFSAEPQQWGSLQQQPLGPPPPAGTPSPSLTGNRSPTPGGSERSGASSQPLLAPPPPNAVVELFLERMERICRHQERLGDVFEDLCCQFKQIMAALGAPIPSQQPLVSGAGLPNPQPLVSGAGLPHSQPHLNNGMQSQTAPLQPDMAPEQPGNQ